MAERKAFNFYASFFDVYKQLNTDKDKVAFIEALLEKQFYGIDPKGLTGMALFAYESQKQVINQQVVGWEKKTNTPLTKGVDKGGAEGGCQGGSVQEEEKGEEKEEVEYTIDFKKLLEFINNKTGRGFKKVNEKARTKYKARLKEGYTKEDIFNAIRNAVEVQYHIDNNNQYLTPEFFSRADTLDKYGGEYKNPYSINVGVTID